MDDLSPRARSTRDAILKAALSCFAADGFGATTTRGIAARAGVTQPLIHHYFGSKEALFDAVLDHAAADYEIELQPQFALELDDLRFMTEGLPVLFGWLQRQRELLRLSGWARLEGKRAPNTRGVALFGRIGQRLAHARANGILRPEIDVDVAMVLIEAMFKGYWDRRESIETYLIDANDLDARYLDQALRVLFAGMLTPEAERGALALLDARRG